MEQAIYRVTDYLRLEVTKISIDQLIKEVKDILKLQDVEREPQILIKKRIEIDFIKADIAKIKQLIVDSTIYIQQHNKPDNPIILSLENVKLGHTIKHMKDYTRKLDALKMLITSEKNLPVSHKVYMISPINSENKMYKDVTAVDGISFKADGILLENARIIDAHYGYADLSKNHTHIYVIPVNVREVRGNVMELLQEPASVEPEELQHPLAIKLEKELLMKLHDTQVDLNVIHLALEKIKKYHGGVKVNLENLFLRIPLQ